MTPGQEKHLAEKLDGWTCEGQDELFEGVSAALKPESGSGEEEQPR